MRLHLLLNHFLGELQLIRRILENHFVISNPVANPLKNM